ncbi:MAG: hypothetical protein IJX75_06000 [Clostridia bacterium]|nr:hypothetical protein [Clostridia bacterium]
MKFVWAGERAAKNRELTFIYDVTKDCDTLRVCAVDAFRVFIDDVFVSYGPERTAAGYVRPREINVPIGAKQIRVCVKAYNIPIYACDMQLPFFGVEVLQNGQAVATTDDFVCVHSSIRVENTPKYSLQRGFVEAFDYRAPVCQVLQTYEVAAPKFLSFSPDRADYALHEFKKLSETDFQGFDRIHRLWWRNRPETKFNYPVYEVVKEFLKKTKKGCYIAHDYVLQTEKTGFILLEVDTEEETEIFVTFDEIQPNGEWIFSRTACNDLVSWKLPKGKFFLETTESYAFRYLKILTRKGVKITPTLRALENATANGVSIRGNEKICKIFNAALNTFRQNALDIFMDCPGRERGGYLCDSYFTAQAERLFCGNNTIERAFLENFIIAEVEEIERDMLPMCFPSSFMDGIFIPNWAMWFVLELYEYYKRTNDQTLVMQAKEKIYGLVSYFRAFENEYGLLENLRNWVFVEWSICNDSDYISGVNFPTNMLYAQMLDTIAKLYGDDTLKRRAETLKETVKHFAFNGEYYVDNALRENGNLVRQENHLSETCQYYALFTQTETSTDFAEKIKNEFGILGKKHISIGESNVFIGYYLRFQWLCDIGEYEKVIEESVRLFEEMADTTGTLWEYCQPLASCNHGFASSIAVFLARSLTGYSGVKDGKPVFDDTFCTGKTSYGVTLRFAYGNEEVIEKVV